MAVGRDPFSLAPNIMYQVPLWLKLAYTVLVAVVVPIYWVRYGPANYLWFSDIAFVLLVPALWLESRMIVSMMALSVLLLEIVWTIDFFVRLISGWKIIGLSSYMFDAKLPIWLRALSLFHLVLPPLLIWLLYRWGYEPRALLAQTVLAWVVLPLSYWASTPDNNVNWTKGFGDQPQTWMPPLVFLLLLMFVFPLVLYVPGHFVLKRLFG
jgi:hypothetical protein